MGEVVDVCADLGYRVEGFLGDGHLGVVAGDGDDILGGDAAGAEGDGQRFVGGESHDSYFNSHRLLRKCPFGTS
ncbi:hypothetical protein D3C84_1237390 [compost metagenome]